MSDWLIVGGGPHGIHLSVRLLRAGVPRTAIRILDPHREPLTRWQSYTGNTGMSHLRSPLVHNLDVEALALEQHASSTEFESAKLERRLPEGQQEPDFIPPYSRPSLALFMHHARSLVEKSGLMRSWIQGRAESLECMEDGYQVTTESGETLRAKNVVLALGSGDQLRWPVWARDLKATHEQAPLDHIFGPCFQRDALDSSEDVVIVGAGISAAQLALSLAETNPDRGITMLSRHSLKQADFDSDPGWLGPRFLREFDAELCLEKRRATIQEARQLGSLAAEVMFDITQSIQAGRVTHTLAHIDGAIWGGDGERIELRMRPMELDESAYHRNGKILSRVSETTRSIAADRVVLATGFKPHRPGGEFLNRAIEALDLPLAPDGFPVVDRHLRWRPGLFVTGPLAELVVGPASRNLSGARMAAKRIVESRGLRFSKRPRPAASASVGRRFAPYSRR